MAAAVAALAVAGLAALWALVALNGGKPLPMDAAAQELLAGRLRSDRLTPVMEGLSNLATPVAMLAMWLVAALFAPGRRPGVAIGANLGAAFALNQLLKLVAQRPRPEAVAIVSVSGYSFPSGHTMVATAFFGLLIYLLWRSGRGRAQRWALSCLLGLLVLSVGVSRIYLGAHYASDVLAGLLASLAWLVAYTRLACPRLLWGTRRGQERDIAAGGAGGASSSPAPTAVGLQDTAEPGRRAAGGAPLTTRKP